MMLSVDSKVVGQKRKLKRLSPEIVVGKADTLDGVESNINIIAKQEYINFPGVGDLGMLHIVMIYQLGRP